MTASPFDFLIGVAAFSGLWFLWRGPLKGLALDAFRERIFEIRFRLFELGMKGELSFDGETYRMLETLLNGLLRYGHRFTFLSYLYSLKQDARARKEKDYVDFSNQVELQIRRESNSAQVVMEQIMRDTQTVLVVYMCFTSLVFLAAAIVMLVLRAFRLVSFSARARVGAIIESEAFRQAARENGRMQAA